VIAAAVRSLAFARPSLGQLDTNDGGESRRHLSRSQELVPIQLSYVPHPLRNTSRKQPNIFFGFLVWLGRNISAREALYNSSPMYLYLLSSQLQNMHSRSFQFQFLPRSKPTSRPASGQTLSTRSYSLLLPALPIGGRKLGGIQCIGQYALCDFPTKGRIIS